MSWPALVLWVVILAGFVSRGPALLYTFQIAIVFNMLQMLPGSSLNFLPGSICAGFLVLKIAIQPGNLSRALDIAFDPARAGLFTVFLAYSLMTCFVLARLFAGQVVVVPIAGIGADFVAPSAGNISQSLYVLLSFSTMIAVAVGISNPTFERHYLRAVLLGGVTIILAGLIDLVTFRTGHGAWLDPFRTASYNLLGDAEIAGAKRIVGFSPEASSYGALCIAALTSLTFLRPFFEPRARRLYVPLVIAGLVTMTILCTSSSAYAGFLVFAAVYAVSILLRLGSTDAVMREGLGVEFALLAGLVFVGLAIAVFAPATLTSASQIFDTMVLHKTDSSSYTERSMWTRTGFQAFLDTGLVGVGVGSVRTSNWFVSILASSGLFGAALLFGFILYILFWPRPDLPARTGRMRRAITLALLPTLVVGSLGGTIPDMGVHTASLYGLLVGFLAVPSRGLRRPTRALAA